MIRALVQEPGHAAGAQDVVPVVAEESFRFLNLPELWVIGLVIVPLLIVFAWWSYGGLARLEPSTRFVLASLRALAIAACLVALFQPVFELVRYTKTQTQVHVLVDDSASMSRKDNYPDAAQHDALARESGVSELATQTRADLVRQVLGKPGGLVDELRKTHDVRLFKFSRKPTPIRDLTELAAKAPRTQIGDALDLHFSESGASNLDAVILVSDGCNNAGIPPIEAAAKYRVADTPVYTIGVGDPKEPRNIRLVGPPGPKEALRKEEIAFDVTLSSEGLEDRAVTVALQGSRDGGLWVPLTSASATLGKDGVPVKVRLYHSFEQAGDWSLKFSVTTLPDETSLEDNVDTRFLRVNDEKIRVLFIDDLPRWEYRYIHTGLERVDPSIVVQSFMFDANADFHQEHSEDVEPLKDIPRTRQDLARYHVILIGDVPPERIAPTEEKRNEWMQWLTEFVENGGGVGFQWGEAAMPEHWRGTPLEDLLPVVLEDTVELARLRTDFTAPFAPRLENPGRPHDITLLRRDPEANAKLWHEGFEPVYGWYPVQQAKAGAEVLLRHPTEKNRYGNRVIAAGGFYPRGRTFFIATDETFKWRKPYGEKYHDGFWRNVVRWLASGKLRRRDDRVEMRLDKVVVETGETISVTLAMRDLDWKNANAPDATVFFRRADGKPEKRVLRAVTGEEGTWQGTFAMPDAGTVSVLAFEHDNPQENVLAREDVLVKIPDREMQQSSQDRATLEKIAAQSKGGRYVFLADAMQLMRDFRGRKPFEQEVDRSTRPAWDNLWTLLVILLLLATEWILRKRALLV